MKTAAHFSSSAELELDEATRRYEEQRAGLGNRFRLAVQAAVEWLSDDPSSWPGLEEGLRRCRVAGFPYDIVFLPSESDILIIAVAHHRRRPEYWQTRPTNE